MPIPSSDDSRPDTVSNSHGSRRISREIANLQQEIRDDFDQKLKDLSGLMVKFRSLLANDGQLGVNLPGAANDATLAANPDDNSKHGPKVGIGEKNTSDVPKDIPILNDRATNDADLETDANVESERGARRLKLVASNSNGKPDGAASKEKNSGSDSSGTALSGVSRFATEPARFESGLYQLNSQLYRFKLELDQELEFREEPLHLHFQHQSELAKVLQQITEKMQQEKNTGH